MENQNKKGVLCVLAASVLFGLSPSLTTILLQEGYPRESLMLFRFLFAAVSSVAAAGLGGVNFRVTKRQLFDLAFFGVFGWGLTGILQAASFQYIPSGLATLFHFSYPIIVLVASALLFGEIFDRKRAAAVVVAMAGILCIVDLSGSMSMVGVGCALASGVTYAVFVLAGKKSSYAKLPARIVPCYCCTFCAIAYGILAAATGRMVMPSGIRQWSVLAVTGVLGGTLACCLLTVGIRILGSTRASIINTLEPVTSMICGTAFLQEAVTGKTLGGCLLIAFSIILTSLERTPLENGKQSKKQSKKQTMRGG